MFNSRCRQMIRHSPPIKVVLYVPFSKRDLKNCQLIVDPNYQYQGKSAFALTAEKDLWVMNFISYLNVMVLKNLGY